MHVLITNAPCPLGAGERSIERGERAVRAHRLEVRGLQKELLDGLSAAPESVDGRGLHLPPKQRIEAITRLRRHLRDSIGENVERALAACTLLAQLGDESGTRGLVRFLGSDSPYAKRSALVELGPPASESERREPRNERLRRALCRPAVLAAVVAVLSEPDPWNRTLAARLGEFWALPIPESVLFAALANRTGTPSLVSWLCSRGYDPRTATAAREMLLDETQGAREVIAGLEHWLKSAQMRAREESEEILLNLLSQERQLEWYGLRDNQNPRILAVRALACSGSSAGQARVQAMARSSDEPGSVRIEAWVQLIMAGCARLEEVAESDLSPTDQASVVSGLVVRVGPPWMSNLFGTTPEQVERITGELLALRRQTVVPEIAKSLEEGLPLLRVPPADRKPRVRSRKVAPVERCADWSEVAKGLVASGALTAAEARKALARTRAVRDEGSSPDWFRLVHECGRFTLLDTECGDIPPLYETPLRLLTAGSAGKFRPTSITQVWHKDDSGFGDSHLVTFVLKGNLVSFHARNLGDYYDVPALLTAANEALDAAKIRERFVLLESGDQQAFILFVQPLRLRAIEAFVGRRREADLDAPMRAGRAGEACARTMIG